MGIVPDEINRATMDAFEAGGIQSYPAGTPFSQCYPAPSPIGAMLRLPKIQGALASLVGPHPLFDHHAIHVRQPMEGKAQGMHGDSIIDTRLHFDVQLMYFPHNVPEEMGGTLLLPGSHFRRINEAEISRYQNFIGQIPMICEAGSILLLHHGIWHCGRQNRHRPPSATMYKIRLNPTVRQLRLWNTDDLDENTGAHQPIFAGEKRDDVQAILSRQEPWFEGRRRPPRNHQPHPSVALPHRRRTLRRPTTGCTRLENMPETRLSA